MITLSNQMVSALIRADASFPVGERAVLFTIDQRILFRQDEQYALYDVSPDDQRFVFMRGMDVEVSEPELILVDNWVEGLRPGSAGS